MILHMNWRRSSWILVLYLVGNWPLSSSTFQESHDGSVLAHGTESFNQIMPMHLSTCCVQLLCTVDARSKLALHSPTSCEDRSSSPDQYDGHWKISICSGAQSASQVDSFRPGRSVFLLRGLEALLRLLLQAPTPWLINSLHKSRWP